MPDYEDNRRESLMKHLKDLRDIAPTYQSVNDLESEEDEAAFVQAFRKLMRTLNVLQSYTDFDWDDLPLNAQEFEDYKGKYLDIYEKVQKEAQKEKISILDDIDFELELIHRDRINRAYILKLLKDFKEEIEPSKLEAQKKQLLIY